jgi:hypothetical protein
MLLLRQERFAGAAAGILLRSGVPYLQVFPALSRARGVAVPDTDAQVAWVQAYAKMGL